jgi:hypothetical protein
MIRKEAGMAEFEIISRHLVGGTEATLGKTERLAGLGT